MEHDNRETAVINLNKELIPVDNYADFIENHIYKNLLEMLMTKVAKAIQSNDEILIKLEGIASTENPYMNNVEYRAEIKWSPFIRCGKCRHWEPNLHTCIIHGGVHGPDSYCNNTKENTWG